jgi:hypothetical protein
VPSVQHLHGEPVALSDPGDQDFVRSRLCTQWPSRKVGRVGLPWGSKGEAKFFELADLHGCICDVPHKRSLSRENRTGNTEIIPVYGIMIRGISFDSPPRP